MVSLRFNNYIGIDYSGAKTSLSRLAQLQIYTTNPEGNPRRINPPEKRVKNWCRKELTFHLKEILKSKKKTIIGIDHGLSFPYSFYKKNKLKNWDRMLAFVSKTWKTSNDSVTVEDARKAVGSPGQATDYRLTEKWMPAAKSVFHFDVQGSVAKSTHAGIPWIYEIIQDVEIRNRTHFWPFDGLEVQPDQNVIAEIFPSLFRRRYKKGQRSDDQHDAFVASAWLRDMDKRGLLNYYFNPMLSDSEKQLVFLEGWILGVL
ncbi:MAG: hypothetical protein CBC29_00250 [Methylococcaceae bacterium TMED69]|nr:MAG: hypothetical protein CBC29_00250 [Methylococcaceae bacterium TMED69]